MDCSTEVDRGEVDTQKFLEHFEDVVDKTLYFEKIEGHSISAKVVLNVFSFSLLQNEPVGSLPACLLFPFQPYSKKSSDAVRKIERIQDQIQHHVFSPNGYSPDSFVSHDEQAVSIISSPSNIYALEMNTSCVYALVALLQVFIQQHNYNEQEVGQKNEDPLKKSENPDVLSSHWRKCEDKTSCFKNPVRTVLDSEDFGPQDYSPTESILTHDVLKEYELDWMFYPSYFGVTSAHSFLSQQELVCCPVSPKYPTSKNYLLSLIRRL